MGAIVITGSSRGIGFGLADAFLARGGSVVVAGRDPRAVAEAVARLQAAHDPARVVGCRCDITKTSDLEALWEAATVEFAHDDEARAVCEREGAFGDVDVWINNAGSHTSARVPSFHTFLCKYPTGLLVHRLHELRRHARTQTENGSHERQALRSGGVPLATRMRRLRVGLGCVLAFPLHDEGAVPDRWSWPGPRRRATEAPP